MTTIRERLAERMNGALLQNGATGGASDLGMVCAEAIEGDVQELIDALEEAADNLQASEYISDNKLADKIYTILSKWESPK